MKDESFEKPEVKKASDLLVKMGLETSLNFKDEMVRYREYRASITDDSSYVDFLINTIQPVNELALYSYCVELCLSDDELSPRESSLLTILANRLALEPTTANTIMHLMAQRKVSENEKVS